MTTATKKQSDQRTSGGQFVKGGLPGPGSGNSAQTPEQAGIAKVAACRGRISALVVERETCEFNLDQLSQRYREDRVPIAAALSELTLALSVQRLELAYYANPPKPSELELLRLREIELAEQLAEAERVLASTPEPAGTLDFEGVARSRKAYADASALRTQYDIAYRDLEEAEQRAANKPVPGAVVWGGDLPHDRVVPFESDSTPSTSGRVGMRNI